MGQPTDQLYIEAMLRQGHKCAWCGESLDGSAYVAHHMRRQTDGGDDTLNNIALLCSDECHLEAHNGNHKIPIETTSEAYPYFYAGKDKASDKDIQGTGKLKSFASDAEGESPNQNVSVDNPNDNDVNSGDKGD